MRWCPRPVLLILAGAAAGLAACTPVPTRFAPGVAARWVASPNFDLRRPQFVILHHTGNDTAQQALATLTNPARMVSAHYLVGRDGTIYQLVDERYRAWHAGASSWGSDEDLNSSSIGIEMDNNGAEPYPPAQVEALLALLADLESRYDIPRENFLGHGDIAPGRKVDPGVLFPWRQLAGHGFGAWCDPQGPASIDTGNPASVDPDDATLLAILGYDTANPGAAIRAFNRHFMALEDEPVLSPEGRAVLECLVAAKAPST
ncbi:MAG TPA: N-acetylmuramoyl-L-alanine amidase [Usitatibacter sp.]|jgi:N-acetylmuramoyl-L-alanine amidase|nr:N-acetylmuramoyl-L-alanine amidase [Usitatibacter sp.]